MTPTIQVSTFTYDEAIKALDAATRGYTTLRGLYSRPGRAEKFLRKRLNELFDQGYIYRPGDIFEFTVKARKYRIFTLILPYKDEVVPKFLSISRPAILRQYRFFDTLEEALHMGAMRELPQYEPRDFGHLKHRTPLR